MIYLVTGTPGAGKTLFTIKQLSEIRDRPVYYYKIKLKPAGVAALPNWIEITKEDVENWPQYPDNSIFLIDEAHTVFPQRGASSSVKPFVEGLAEHRHRGMDFYIIDQHPKDIDVFIRRRTYQHWHWVNVFGFDSSSKLSWQGFNDDQPDDYHAKQRAEKTRHNFPRSVYDYYESATQHTKKKRIPWQLYAIPLLLLAVGATVYFLFGFLGVGASDPVADASVSAPAPVPAAVPAPVVPGKPVVVSAAVPAGFIDSPRKRPLYYNFSDAAIPDYIFTVKTAYLEGSFDVFGHVGAEYRLVLEDGSVLNVDNKFFTATGAKIQVIEPKCTHRISYRSFDLFTRCSPKKTEDENRPLKDASGIDTGADNPPVEPVHLSPQQLPTQ